jgi:hypothetical protein
MKQIIPVSIVLLVVLAFTTASFHFTPADLKWPGGHDLSVPGPARSDGLISIDYMKNATKDPGTGRLSSNWLDFTARGETDMTGRAAYLGFNYTPSAGTPYSGGELYYTGESSGGKRIYVSPADERKSRVPDAIYLSDGAGGGNYTRYVITGKPPVYAYTPYRAYNTNETVAFGLADDSGGSIELKNAAPYEIQRKEAAGWVTVFSPVAAQVIVPMENGTFREWRWDQRLGDGTLAPFGDYRVVIADTYVTSFSISADKPSVERSQADYTRESAEAAFTSPPQADGFLASYRSAPYTMELQDDLVSEMLFKAWARKLDPGQLEAAVNATGLRGTADYLPFLAVRGSYEGKPAWLIDFAYEGHEAALSRVRYFVVGDDAKVIAGGPISV